MTGQQAQWHREKLWAGRIGQQFPCPANGNLQQVVGQVEACQQLQGWMDLSVAWGVEMEHMDWEGLMELALYLSVEMEHMD